MMRVAVTLLAVATGMLLPGAAAASPGDVDPDFGTNGVARVTQLDAVNELAETDAGVIYAAGPERAEEPSAKRRVSIVRLDPGGTPDPSWGDGGVLSLNGLGTFANAIALTDDGGLLLLTMDYESGGEGVYSYLVKLEADGSFDGSFGGGDGRVKLGELGAGASAGSMAVDPEGRILLVADSLVRLLADGNPDPAFGSGGTASFPDDFRGADVALGSGGRIFVGGSTVADDHSAVARYRGDGTLDPVYGNAGVAFYPQDYAIYGYGFALDERDRAFLASGDCFPLGPSPGCWSSFTVLAADGSTEAGFPEPGPSTSGNQLLPDPDGGLIDSGYPRRPYIPRFPYMARMTRFTPEWNGDEQWGLDGRNYFLVGRWSPVVSGLVETADGEALLAPGYLEPAQLPGSYGTIIRVLETPGVDDTDGDRVTDSRDKCPWRVERRGPTGCPNLGSRRIVVERVRRHLISGRVEASNFDCYRRSPVKLIKRRPGRDRVLAEVRSNRGVESGAFHFDRGIPRKASYVKLPVYFADGVGFCRADRSARLRLGTRSAASPAEARRRRAPRAPFLFHGSTRATTGATSRVTASP